MREEVKAVYRSTHLVELARSRVVGEFDVEAWKSCPLDTTSLKREIMKIKGVGV